jgi:hypothetical protein
VSTKHYKINLSLTINNPTKSQPTDKKNDVLTEGIGSNKSSGGIASHQKKIRSKNVAFLLYFADSLKNRPQKCLQNRFKDILSMFLAH